MLGNGGIGGGEVIGCVMTGEEVVDEGIGELNNLGGIAGTELGDNP